MVEVGEHHVAALRERVLGAADPGRGLDAESVDVASSQAAGGAALGRLLPARLERATSVVWLDVTRWRGMLGLIARSLGPPRRLGAFDRLTWETIRFVLIEQPRQRPAIAAILSRQVGVVRNQALILNLPGQPKAIKETLDGVFPAVPYCIDLIGGPYIETDESVCKAFRPKSAVRPK